MESKQPRARSTPEESSSKPRAQELASGEETELNMTPMIDIVFQLIIFFLLSLKFKTIDQRIDCRLPKDRGPTPSQAHPPELMKVKVKLFRNNKGDEERAFTRIRVGNARGNTFDLPAGPWPRSGEAADTYRRERDKVFAQVRQVVDRMFEAQGRKPEVRGEIVAPPPNGGAVPHADVIRILDTMVDVGLEQVIFEGVSAPLPRSEGGHGP